MTSLDTLTFKSMADTSAQGTLKAMPLILPLTDGRTFAMAFAAPVLEGIMFKHAPLPEEGRRGEGIKKKANEIVLEKRDAKIKKKIKDMEMVKM